MPVYLTPPPRNPLAQAAAAVVALLALVGAFMLGIVALAVFAGLALAASLALWLRAKWLSRADGPAPSRGAGSGHRSRTIEAEYTVVRRRRDPPD